MYNDANADTRRIKQLQREIEKLIKSREKELERIRNARWEAIAGGKLLVNKIEGKIQINKTEVLFSSIKGADLNIETGARIETFEKAETKTKKHASIGGAVAGGLLLGPAGAVAGGLVLGKKKGTTKGNSVSKEVPTCSHLGVKVNIDGFVSEIILLSGQVDQSSPIFTKAQNDAQNIVAKLSILAKTPVPSTFPKPEEESSIKDIERQIEIKNQELKHTVPNGEDYVYKQYQTMKSTDSKTGTVNKIGSVLYKGIFWILSVIMAFIAVVMFSSNATTSGIIFLITAVIINPKINELICDYLFEIPKWVPIAVLLIGFIAGIMKYPSSNPEPEMPANSDITEEMTVPDISNG